MAEGQIVDPVHGEAMRNVVGRDLAIEMLHLLTLIGEVVVCPAVGVALVGLRVVAGICHQLRPGVVRAQLQSAGEVMRDLQLQRVVIGDARGEVNVVTFQRIREKSLLPLNGAVPDIAVTVGNEWTGSRLEGILNLHGSRVLERSRG